MGVEFRVNVGEVLGVLFEEVGVDNLEIVCLDLSPAGAARVLPEVYKLGFCRNNKQKRE